MEEFNKLFEEFNKMGLDAKRNAYSEEMIKTYLILKSLLNKFGTDVIEKPYNYILEKDKSLSETQLLNINFKDIYYFKTELLMLLNYINLKDSGDN